MIAIGGSKGKLEVSAKILQMFLILTFFFSQIVTLVMIEIPENFQVWDTLSEAGITNRFSKYSKPNKSESVS